jgi:hypothetical protein
MSPDREKRDPGPKTCPDNDFGLMTTISAIALRARLAQQHEIRISLQLADGHQQYLLV